MPSGPQPATPEVLGESAGLTDSARLLVLLTTSLCGAAVMEIEVLGARVVSPWFGVSLFVWTSLITVTLLALAAGYFLGGRLADWKGNLRTLAWVVGGAGLLLLAVPLLRAPVLQFAAKAGMRGGALLAAFTLFGLPLTLLGMVTPFVVKLFLLDMEQTGRTVGRLSALSTLGSFVGTVITGFWLIPYFHVDQIAGGSAFILLLLSGGLLGASLKKATPLVVSLPALLFLSPPPFARVVMPSGTVAEVVARQGSFYGSIRVVDYTYPPNHIREMVIGGTLQGAMDMVTGNPVHPYDYFLEQAALSYVPAAKRALIIGLGPGLIPNRLAQYGLTGTVVEIDPHVADVARTHFGFRQGAFQLAVADGRQFIESTGEMYDLILLDAFAAENEPSHLFTLEAFRAMKRHLNPGGAMVINLAALAPGSAGGHRVLDSVLRTMAEVFPWTRALHNPRATPETVANYTLVGSTASDPVITPRAFLPVYSWAEPFLDGFLSTRYVPSASGAVYTDDWCPVEAQGAATKLIWRQQEIGNSPAEILLD